MSWLKSSPTTPRSVSRERSQPDPISPGKIDYSALEETYRLDPEGCYRVDFASGATFFGNNGEIISITVVAIRDGLVGGFEIADDAESKSITLYGKDATLYWGEDQECAGRNRYRGLHLSD